jgi:hypothetical protein
MMRKMKKRKIAVPMPGSDFSATKPPLFMVVKR